MVLGITETELKIGFFLINMGVYVYTVILAAELEEGESSGSLIEFV